MSRSAFSLITSRLSCAISSCSGFIWPCPGNACCGSSANFFTQLRNCVSCTPRSSAACAYETPRSLISRTASSLNSRVNCRLSMTHLLLHKTPNSVSSEPGAAQNDLWNNAKKGQYLDQLKSEGIMIDAVTIRPPDPETQDPSIAP